METLVLSCLEQDAIITRIADELLEIRIGDQGRPHQEPPPALYGSLEGTLALLLVVGGETPMEPLLDQLRKHGRERTLPNLKAMAIVVEDRPEADRLTLGGFPFRVPSRIFLEESSALRWLRLRLMPE